MRSLMVLTLAAAASLAPPVAETAHALSSFYAVVNVNGGTVNGSGVQSSSRVSAGKYYVNFTREIKDCAMTASITGANAGFASIEVTTLKRVVVTTYNTNGTISNRSFNLMVSCAP